MSDTDQAIEAFNAHVKQLEAEHGVELDAAERQRVFGLSVANGFGPESTVEAFGDLVGDVYEQDYDEDYEDAEPEVDPNLVRHLNDDLQRLSSEYGRPLTAREQEIAARGALEQAERYDQINPQEALDDHYRATRETRPDTRTQEGRQEFFKQRLSEMDVPSEPPDRPLDLSNAQDRSAFLNARMEGHEFEDAGEEAA
jgi:hypothetical protein